MPSAEQSKNHSIALCIPSSCISAKCCRSQTQASHIAHQIARTAILYSIDEIIIYPTTTLAEEPVGEPEDQTDSNTNTAKKIVFSDDTEDVVSSDEKSVVNQELQECTRLAGLLQFFITPTYLRKSLFKDLKAYAYAKKLPKIPGLPFMNHASGKYLEGLTVKGKIENKQMETRIKKKNKHGHQKSRKELEAESKSKYVNVGLPELVELTEQKVPLAVRVTVDMESKKVVSPKTAYGKTGFGYSVRVVSSFAKIFTESPYADGYSKTIYVPSEEFTGNVKEADIPTLNSSVLTGTPDLLFLYGKWKEVCHAVKADSELSQLESPQALFDGKLDVQRGVRTEDVLLMSLAQTLH